MFLICFFFLIEIALYSRPNVELCRDNVQYGLTDEVKQLDASKRSLEEKLKQAQYVVTLLIYM